jgi:hypothetical protein
MALAGAGGANVVVDDLAVGAPTRGTAATSSKAPAKATSTAKPRKNQGGGSNKSTKGKPASKRPPGK